MNLSEKQVHELIKKFESLAVKKAGQTEVSVPLSAIKRILNRAKKR